jgi:uncharacterized protein YprB with RNaseH-like and TPR domain
MTSQSTIDMTLWFSNTTTNILLHLISDMEIKMVSDIHLLHNERKIKHKHKNVHIQTSHLIYSAENLIQKFQTELKSELAKLTKNNNTTLTINMNKIKQHPHLFHEIIKAPKLPNQLPKNILQISSHHQIHHQLKYIQNDLVFLDTETDGLSIHKSNILSICLTTININSNPITSQNSTEKLFYIKPYSTYTVDTSSQAFKVNQISQSTINKKGVMLANIAPEILKLLTTKIVVGFNINSFDIPIIRNNLKKYKIHLPPIMTIDLYQAHHKLIKHDLNSALKDLKCYPIDKNNQHSANGDADACIRLLAAFTSELDLPLTKQTYLSQQNQQNPINKHQIFHTNI